MAKKLTELAAETDPVIADIVAIVDDTGGTPVTEKATLGNLTKGLDVSALTAATVATGDLVMISDVDASNVTRKVTAQSIADLNTGGVAWNNVTGTSQTLATENAYIANAATLCTLTLPTVASTSIGDYIRVVGAGVGGWKIAQVALSQIISNEGGVDGTNESTIGTGGSLASTDDRDAVELVCTFDDGTNVEWTVIGVKGNPDLT